MLHDQRLAAGVLQLLQKMGIYGTRVQAKIEIGFRVLTGRVTRHLALRGQHSCCGVGRSLHVRRIIHRNACATLRQLPGARQANETAAQNPEIKSHPSIIKIFAICLAPGALPSYI
jgi:hypothetical protein